MNDSYFDSNNTLNMFSSLKGSCPMQNMKCFPELAISWLDMQVIFLPDIPESKL